MGFDKMKNLSLTERRKMETRKAIADAACDLFLRDGFDNVTVEAIAAESGVSLRTFYRYSPSKEDVLAPIINEGMIMFVDLIDDRPEEEDLATAILEAFREISPDDNEDGLRQTIGLMLEIPALRARWLDSMRQAEERLVPVIMRRTGNRPSELEARITASAAISTLRLALENTVATNSGRSLIAELETSLEYFRQGAGLNPAMA